MSAVTLESLSAKLDEIRASLDVENAPVLSTEQAAAYVGCVSEDAFYKWAAKSCYKSAANGRHHRSLLDEALSREVRKHKMSGTRRKL